MSDLIYRYVPGRRPETLLLLHGTGGNETDLLALGEAMLPGAGLLSPRVKRRAAELGEFVREKAEEYGFDAGRVLAMGYSNGANIAAAMLLTGAAAFPRAVLVRAMVPVDGSHPEALPDLAGTEVLLAAGRYDPIATPAQTRSLGELLKSAGATVTEHTESSGHEMTRGDIEAAARWLARK